MSGCFQRPSLPARELLQLAVSLCHQRSEEEARAAALSAAQAAASRATPAQRERAIAQAAAAVRAPGQCRRCARGTHALQLSSVCSSR